MTGNSVPDRRPKTRAQALRLVLLLPFLIGVSVRWSAAPAAGPDDAAESLQQESELGKSMYEELKLKREIIASSPLLTILSPIANEVAQAAQPRYGLPIRILLVHDPQPNAYAAPGGNVYVTDELLYFVRNRDELAGTLCHEVSHLIHHDSMTLIREQMKIMGRELGAAILLGPSAGNALAAMLLGRLHTLKYSREVESQADLTGADICASAGLNPWGLVWLFDAFKDANPEQVPQFLSDHPGNDARIASLEAHFKDNPQLFGRYSQDANSAASLTVAANAPVVFLR